MKLTEEEREQLQARAGELGISVPRLLVESALAPHSETVTESRQALAGLFATERLLATIANNVNQLARIANTTGQLPAASQLEGMVREVVEVLRLLRELNTKF